MKKSKATLIVLLLMAACLWVLTQGEGLAQEETGDDGEAEAGEATAEDDAGEGAETAEAEGETSVQPEVFPQLLSLNLEWINSDICRLIEVLREARDPWERREIVEQIEYLIFRHVEDPLVFKQHEISDELDLERIGTVSDAVDAGAASPLASLIAEAYALYGIAKGYEGFAAAANDQIARAKRIYSEVESLSVQIDHFQDRKTIKNWLLDSMANWASTNAVRISFHGKNVTQQSALELTPKQILFTTEQNEISDYYLEVARRDFWRGMQRYIVTDDRMTERRPNIFYIYLPPGVYQLKTSTTTAIPIEIKTSADPDENHYIVESLEDGITCYPRPKLVEEE